MRKKIHLLIVISVLFITGCIRSTYSVKEFNSYISPKSVNGTYLNHDKLLRVFHPKGEMWWGEKDICDLVSINFNGKDTLKVLYHTEQGITEYIYPGKSVKNYFTFHYSKKRFYIPPIFGRTDIEWFRVGNDKNGNLLARWYNRTFGNFLFFGMQIQEIIVIFFAR